MSDLSIYISVDHIYLIFNMLVLFLFATSHALNLTNFEKFEIELDADCLEYFILQGEDDYVYFYQKNGQFELWVTQNASKNASNYEIYTLPWMDSLKFGWPNKIINNKTMNLILHEGSIEYPLNFYSEIMLCEVFRVSVGLLNVEESVRGLFKCPMLDNWIKEILITVIVVLFLILIGVKNESIRAILGPKVSGILWWYQQILSRSQEAPSRGETERYHQLSKGTESIHLTQANSETQEISKNSSV